MKSIFIIINLSILLIFSAKAQETLSLEDAIAEALQANYGLQVQRIAQQKAENSSYAGGAGLLPSVTLGANGQYSWSSASGDFLIEGRAVPFDTAGITNSSAGAQAQLSYTLALANFNQFEVLQTSALVSEQQTQQIIESTALQVSTAYYNLGKLASRLNLQREALDRSRVRLQQVQNQQEFGSSNRLAVLNAQVNINTDSVSWVSTRLSYENARRDLNILIGRPVESQYAVETKVAPAEELSYELLEEQLLSTNAGLQVAETNRQLAELSLKTAQARRYPTLTMNGTYGVNYTNNPFSIAPELINWGPSVSASLNFNLFNGFQTSRQIQGAELDVASSRARYQETEQNALRDLAKAYADYNNNWQVYQLSQMSLEAAQLNFDRTQEAMRLGQATSLDLRQAQLNLQQVENQLNDLLFDLKLNEVQLMQLSGQLVK